MSGFGEFSSGAAQQITCPALRMRKPLASKKVRHAVQSFVCHAPITIQPPTARGALLSRPAPAARVPDTVEFVCHSGTPSTRCTFSIVDGN